MTQRSERGWAGRLAALVGATALAITGAVAAAAPASATDPFDMPEGPGTLTIHKFVQPDPAGSDNSEGEELLDTSAWTPLGNVVFTITPITNVDLTTEAGWDLANDYALDPADTSMVLGAPITVTTLADGSIPEQSLPNGAYLITETDYSGATLPGGEPANVVIGSAPFVVTIPIPLGNGEWNTDVHVYPKNSLTEVEKTVADPETLGLGSTVTWTVDAAIPTLPEGEFFTEFHITDTLDSRLGYVNGSATITIDGIDVAATITHTGEAAGGTLTVTLDDPAGLDAIEANQGGTITLSFDTIVLALGDGEIPNTATVFINQPTDGNGTDTNTPVTYWGAVQITKHATGNTGALLDGAVFSVYPTLADAEAGTNEILIDGEATFTTVDGVAVIPGLWAGTDGTGVTYWLVEVEAPDGYILNSTPIEVEVTAGSVTEAAAAPVLVPNAQQPLLSLPLTGGSGTAMLITGGIGLLLAAVGIAVFASRRRTVAESHSA